VTSVRAENEKTNRNHYAGLSWLIGGSLQEVLISIIFLFIKHPFDVGDRINFNKTDYTVKEIRLLTSILLDSNGTLVQAPNTVLNTMVLSFIDETSALLMVLL